MRLVANNFQHVMLQAQYYRSTNAINQTNLRTKIYEPHDNKWSSAAPTLRLL